MDIKIDYNKVFSVLPQIMSMPMELVRNRWYAARRIDGRFSNRKDKLVCRPVNDGIQILEQGGDAMTLFSWMLKYGGCKDSLEVKLKLMNLSAAIINVPDYIDKKIEQKFVPKEFLERSYENRIYNPDNFTLFLKSIFGSLATEHTLRKYKVGQTRWKIKETENYENLTTFWYINKNNEILHDKIILFKPDGHRDHSFGGSRSHTIRKGYSGNCLFGEHLLRDRKDGERVFVVESEKAAIIGSLYFGNSVWLATGGKNNFIYGNADEGYTYLADIDAYEYWNTLRRGNCPKWFDAYPDWHHGEKDDIADLILDYLIKK